MIEEKEFQVRTFIVGDDREDKKTLVFTHGFVGSMVMYFAAMARLAQKYRLVMFDNCCKGLNTKLDTSEALQSSEAAEQWMLDFMVKTIDALDLPDKCLLAGHSYGGFLVSLYASQRPERVESLFLISPAFFEPFEPESFDPTQFSA